MDHPDEARRLTELHSLGILDSAPEPGFDDLAQLAADLTGSPVALVTLIDEQRQWFKAKVGTDLCAVGRDIAFCDHVVRGRAELEVSDLRIDPRFASNPFVTGPPHAVFYAGFPVLLETGSILGTICVIDLHERELTERQREQMRALARQVSTQLELRRRTIEQAREIELRTTAQRQLARSRSEYRLLTENSGDVIARWTVDGRVTYMSPSAGSVLGLDTERDLGTRLIDRVHPDDQPVLREAHAAVLRGGAELITLRMPASGGDWHWLECTLSPLHDPDKGELEIHCAAREVTERVTAAARIAQSEERFPQHLPRVPDGYHAHRHDGPVDLGQPGDVPAARGAARRTDRADALRLRAPGRQCHAPLGDARPDEAAGHQCGGGGPVPAS
ncbi:hypothetical protein JCM9957A_36530 [Kineosporia succinea]